MQMEPTFKYSMTALIAMWCALALTSCGDRYELAQDKEGRTIRLDKRTGEVAVIVGDRLVIAKTPEQVEAEETDARQEAEVLGSPKNWPQQTLKQIGVTTASLTTAWKDGSLRYQLYLLPVPKNYENNDRFSAPLVLRLYDDLGSKS